MLLLLLLFCVFFFNSIFSFRNALSLSPYIYITHYTHTLNNISVLFMRVLGFVRARLVWWMVFVRLLWLCCCVCCIMLCVCACRLRVLRVRTVLLFVSIGYHPLLSRSPPAQHPPPQNNYQSSPAKPTNPTSRPQTQPNQNNIGTGTANNQSIHPARQIPNSRSEAVRGYAKQATVRGRCKTVVCTIWQHRRVYDTARTGRCQQRSVFPHILHNTTI